MRCLDVERFVLACRTVAGRVDEGDALGDRPADTQRTRGIDEISRPYDPQARVRR